MATIRPFWEEMRLFWCGLLLLWAYRLAKGEPELRKRIYDSLFLVPLN